MDAELPRVDCLCYSYCHIAIGGSFSPHVRCRGLRSTREMRAPHVAMSTTSFPHDGDGRECEA